MIKISVIVPVYNVEKYIEKCLKSLVNQTLKDIEIIVVNDGSPDNSQDIIDKYKKEYPSLIKSYVKENGGLSDARNYGLKYAIGEYIGFVDSDDYVEETMFEKMYNKAKEKDFDIVVCDLNLVYCNKSVICTSKLKKDLFNKNEIKRQMVDIYPTAWNKIYKSSVVKEFKFKKSIWYEDVEYLYRLLPNIKNIGVIHEPLYYYLQRDGAITSTFNDKIFDYIDNWNGIIEFYKKNNIFNEYKEEIEYCYLRYIYATMVKSLLRQNNLEKYDYGVKMAIFNVNTNFPNYRKNKYINKINLKNLYLKYFDRIFYKLMRRRIK